MAQPLKVTAKLTLDTSDFKKGSAEADQLGGQMVKGELRRAAQFEAIAAGRVDAVRSAERSIGEIRNAASSADAGRLAGLEALERVVARRRAELGLAQASQNTQQIAAQEAREQAAAKRREERAQLDAQRSAERASQQAAAAQKAAIAAADKESRSAASRAGQLQFQLNDIFTGLGSGQSPLTVAIQQGPQITQIFGGLSNTLAAIPRGFLAAGAAAGAFFAVFGPGIAAAEASAARQRQFNIELTATGNAAAVTAERLDYLVKMEARRAGANRGETASALSAFIGNGYLNSEEELQRSLSVARDLARVQGQELPAAAADFNRSLDGTIAGARRLDQAYNILTAAEYEQIRTLDEQGKKREVVNILLEATERRFKGLNEQGISPTTRYLKELGNAWTEFADKVGKAQITQGMMWAGTQVLKGGAMLFGGPPSVASPNGNNGLTQAEVDKQRADLADAEQRLAELREKQKQPIKPATLDSDIAAASKRVTELRNNVAALQRDLQNGVPSFEQQAAGQAESVRLEIERRAKGYQDLIQQGKSFNQELSSAIKKRETLSEAINSGLLSPEYLQIAKQQMVEINGEISRLNSGLQSQQRTLDLEKKYAGMRPDQAAQERAYDTELKSALDVGATLEEATRRANQARSNVQQQQLMQTQQQIAALGAEARAALEVAAAYGESRAAGIRASAVGAARAAEEQGQIAPGTASLVARETLEKNAAGAVAAVAEKNRAYSEEIAGLGRLSTAEKASAEAAREAERANRVAALATELRALAAASGSEAITAAAEREIAKYEELSRQQLQLDRRRAANQLNAQFDPDTNYRQQTAQLQELQATGEVTARAAAEASKQYEMQRLQASRDATDGMIAGLRQYHDEATNAGRAASEGIQSTMRTLEDNGVRALTTMKFSVTDFVNSAIADLARLAIRQTITGPLASAASSVLGGFDFGSLFGGGNFSIGAVGGAYNGGGSPTFGGPRAGGGPVDPSSYYLVGENGPELFRPKSAGTIMNGSQMRGARELPVFTSFVSDDRRNGDRMAGANVSAGKAGSFTLNLINQGDPLQAKKRESRSDDAGNVTMDVVIEMLEERIGSNIEAGRGRVAGAMQGAYGLQQVGRR